MSAYHTWARAPKYSLYWEVNTPTALLLLLPKNIDIQLFIAKIHHPQNNGVLQQHNKQDALINKSFSKRAFL